MTYLIISDIHANLEALDATLAAAGHYDRVLVLGDLIGYGADPNAVIARVRALDNMTIIRGNHDKVGAGLDDVESFNYTARQAIAWTSSVLTDYNRAWIAELPAGPALVDKTVEICHGTPFDEDVYIFDDLDALRSLRTARRPLCLFGHTHVPALFRLGLPLGEQNSNARNERELDSIEVGHGGSFSVALDADSQYLVNCGAVGQPRDSDRRAAYGFFDTDSRIVTIKRTGYDVAAAQAKIVAAGLPEVLAQRLAVGR